MGLSFLNKKQWHPGSFGNIEKVWIAEQKQKETERKALENMKKLKEERQIEELKKLQVDAGLIPSAHLQRLDWMYQGPECTSDITTAEEYLLGKPLKEQKPEEKKHFTPVFQDSYSNPRNEVFTKMHEDPMLQIRKEEFKQRKDIEENPYKMKQLLKEVEKSIKEKKKHKKEKKHKKHKKHRKNSSSSSSSSSVEFKTPSLIKSKLETPVINQNKVLPQNYGLVDKTGNKIATPNRLISDLKPDAALYRERMKAVEKEKELRRKSESKVKVKELSKEERERMIQEMEMKAQVLDHHKSQYKRSQSESANSNIQISQNSGGLHKPSFMKKVEESTYDGKISLSDRIQRNSAHIKHK